MLKHRFDDDDLIMTENVDFFYVFPTLKRLPVYIIGMK